MARPRKPDGDLDLDLNLEDLPAPARWREWMGRVEAVIFASAEPVLRENLARVVGKACNLDLIIDDIRDELRGRPYERAEEGVHDALSRCHSISAKCHHLRN